MPTPIPTEKTQRIERASRELSIDVLTGPHKGETWHLAQDKISIGRGLENDVVLGDDSTISRTHVTLDYSNGRWTVNDLKSTNGTFLELSSQFFKIINQTDLHQASLLQLGKTNLRLRWN